MINNYQKIQSKNLKCFKLSFQVYLSFSSLLTWKIIVQFNLERFQFKMKLKFLTVKEKALIQSIKHNSPCPGNVSGDYSY